ncbi:hypothetical protein HA466_0052930 [Hirschfeldia incana]|nr:hypothetical protein HA466_0052930 [Hirschfeldia incana]
MVAFCLHNTYIHLNLSHLTLNCLYKPFLLLSQSPSVSPFFSLWILNLDPHILFVDSLFPFVFSRNRHLGFQEQLTSIPPEERERERDRKQKISSISFSYMQITILALDCFYSHTNLLLYLFMHVQVEI